MAEKCRNDSLAIGLFRWGVFALLAGIFFAACGYRLVSTGNFLPTHVKKIAVPVFVNATPQFELDLKLTVAVRDELSIRGKVQIVGDPEDADAILDGTVTGFEVSPIAFSGSDKSGADQYAITIVASITLRDTKNNSVIFSNPQLVYRGDYKVEEGADSETAKTEAITKITPLFARTLVVSILEGF